jgi:ribonuclease HI
VWTIHCDGAWCHAGAGAAAIITSPTGIKHRYAARLSFALESDRCTNNVAEYEAVILGLRKLRALGVTTCIIKTDYKVVAGQVEKEYSAKDPALMQYLTAIRSLERQFKGFTLQHVDHARNEEADALAKAAARGEALPSDVFYHVIGTPAVHKDITTQVMSMRPSTSSTEARTSYLLGASYTRRGSVNPCLNASPKSKASKSFAKSTAKLAAPTQGLGPSQPR